MDILFYVISGLLFVVASFFAYVISGDPVIDWRGHGATPIAAVMFIYSIGFAIAGVLA